MVRRLSDPVVIQRPPEVSIPKNNVPVHGYTSRVPAGPGYHSHSNSSASGSSLEGTPVLHQNQLDLSPSGNGMSQPGGTIPPDQPYHNYPPKGKSFAGRNPNILGEKNGSEMKVFDISDGNNRNSGITSESNEGRRHRQNKNNSRAQKPKSPSHGKQQNRSKQQHRRSVPPFDRYPDIKEVDDEDLYPNYDSALDYDRKHETKFLNSVYDSMYDDPSMHASQLRSGLDLSTNSDSVMQSRSHSPHRQSPHRLSPRFLSPPEVLIPQRLNFDDSVYDDNHNSVLASPHQTQPSPERRSPSKSKLKREPHVERDQMSPTRRQLAACDQCYSKQSSRDGKLSPIRSHSPRGRDFATPSRGPNLNNYDMCDISPDFSHSTPAKGNTNNNSKRIIYRDSEECRDSAISEGGSSHGSGEKIQRCVRDVVSQYMQPGGGSGSRTRTRDADSVDGLSTDSTTTSGSYTVDPEDYSSPNRANLQLFGTEYLIV